MDGGNQTYRLKNSRVPPQLEKIATGGSARNTVGAVLPTGRTTVIVAVSGKVILFARTRLLIP